MAEPNTPKSGKGKGNSTWDSADLLVDLSIGLYQALEHQNGLTTNVKGAVEQYMKAQGHDVSWNSIRQHIQKLRKSRDTTVINEAAGGKKADPENPSKATGRKRAAGPKTPKTPKTPRGGKAAAKGKTMEDLDDPASDLNDFEEFVKKEEAMESGSDEPDDKRLKTENCVDAATEDEV